MFFYHLESAIFYSKFVLCAWINLAFHPSESDITTTQLNTSTPTTAGHSRSASKAPAVMTIAASAARTNDMAGHSTPHPSSRCSRVKKGHITEDAEKSPTARDSPVLFQYERMPSSHVILICLLFQMRSHNVGVH